MQATAKTFVHEYKDLKVHMIPCRRDNYAFVIELANNEAVMVDSTLKEPTLEFLRKNSLDLKAIFLTHHHYDHVDNVEDFQNEYRCPIYCSSIDSTRPDVRGNTTIVKEKNEIKIGKVHFKVFETPGHTKSHLSFFLEKQNIIFCGDLLFSLGCGRVFESYQDVYKDFHSSLQKVKSLCDETTKIFCAHEYTLANFKFLKSQNLCSQNLESEILARLKNEGKTVPTSFSFELKNNSFLKSKTAADFKLLRQLKDVF